METATNKHTPSWLPDTRPVKLLMAVKHAGAVATCVTQRMHYYNM